jgi:hypothetical protein
VAKGLHAGEQVVVNGQLAVTPGGKVHVEEPRSVENPSAHEDNNT